jgi:hypothetical protein
MPDWKIRDMTKRDSATVLYIQVADPMIQKECEPTVMQSLAHVAMLGKEEFGLGDIQYFQSGDAQSRIFYVECASHEDANAYSRILFGVLKNVERSWIDKNKLSINDKAGLKISFAIESKYKEAAERNRVSPGQKFKESRRQSGRGPERKTETRRRTSPRRRERSREARRDVRDVRDVRNKSVDRRPSPRRRDRSRSPRRSRRSPSRDRSDSRRDRRSQDRGQNSGLGRDGRDRVERRVERKDERKDDKEPVFIPGLGQFLLSKEDARAIKTAQAQMLYHQQQQQQVPYLTMEQQVAQSQARYQQQAQDGMNRY